MKKYLYLLALCTICIAGNAQLATFDATVGGGGSGTPSTQNLIRNFDHIVLPDVATDTAAGWNSSTNVYTVPANGLYLITSRLRLHDNTLSAGFTQGVTDVGSTDGPWMAWNQFSGKRTTIVNARTALLTAGEQVTMLGYCDSDNSCLIDSGELTIQQQCTLTNCGGGGGGSVNAVNATNANGFTWTITGSTGPAVNLTVNVDGTHTLPLTTAFNAKAPYPAGSGIPIVSTGTAWGTTVAAPTGAIVGTTDTQTLTAKTLDGVSPATMAFVDPTSSVQTQLNAKAVIASPTFTGTVTTPALLISAITGSTQCLHVNTSGTVSGTGSDCGAGGGSGTVTHTAGALTAGKMVIGNGSADITVDANISSDGSGNLTANSITTGAVTPGADILSDGTGSINGGALPANSAGFSAPASGGTSYLIKLISTLTAGVPFYATPSTTARGVNESVMSMLTVAGSGAGLVTGPTSSTVAGDIATYQGTTGQIQDSGTLLSSLAAKASPTFTGTVTTPALTVSAITGSTQCLQVNTSGVVSGSGGACGGGGSLTGSTGQIFSFTGTNIGSGDATMTNDRAGNIVLYPSLTTALSSITLGSLTNTNGSRLTILTEASYGGDVIRLSNQFGKTFSVDNNGSVTQSDWLALNGVGNIVDKNVPIFQYSVHRTALTASVTTTNIAATPIAGDYRVCARVITTTAGTAGTVLGTVTWSNGILAQSVATPTDVLTTNGSESSACRDYTTVDAGTALAYTTTVAAATGSPQYSLDIQLWRLN